MTLREAIARDILRIDPDPPDLAHCLMCRRAFAAGKGVGANPRFCHQLCVEAYDAGFVYRDAGLTRGDPAAASYSLPVRGDGFLINCRNCKRPFASKGLRCCSNECEGNYREREAIAATMAEVGMELTTYIHRKCEHCGGDIPRYTGIGKARKETRKDARFCSKRCAERARKALLAAKAVSTAE